MHHVRNKMKSMNLSCFFLGCGHCKKAKPLYTNAAAKLKENPKVNF
jgi:thiol-disulfide isomerase/thioredoxin